MPVFASTQEEALSLLDDLIAKARKAGADAADAVLFDSASLSLSMRLGQPERLERSESGDLGLRVFVGKRQAIVSSSDRKPAALDELVERAVAMARMVPEDPYCGIADPDQIFTGPLPDLDVFDATEPAAEFLMDRARIAEATAMAVAGVTNSEGADASWSQSQIVLAASNGFRGGYARSGHGLSVSVLAGEGTGMERDYDFTSGVYLADLADPAEIGRRAGEKAVRRLNPRKVGTQKVPVIYDPRVANGLVGHLSGAINGTGIARGTSFLKEAMGQMVFGPSINIIDDPLKKRGPRSKPFDGEGIPTRRRTVIENGRLTTWFLDLRSARQLGLTTTGHAARGTSGPPSPSATNLYLAPGDKTPAELMADIKQGFYITELMGQGVNGLTGDYSRGAAGFWIENGQLAFPVSEMTVAGNLKDMFRELTPANDLVFRYGVDSPTVRLEGMTVAGM
ncbi:MAG TPA: TldD/PmbA family protein [Azospirillaceae bacterium]|nr:TldD/PmbA family protein [Azospirillaceae bacterium]